MRAVVLGATGHIGAHVVRALLAGGHQVRAAERGRLGERYLLTCRNLTLKALADIAAACAGTPPPR